VSTSHKVILGIALAVSFAPFLGYLALGLLFLPMWLLMFGLALIQGDPEVVHFLPVVVPMLGGLAGAWSMYYVIGRVYGLPVRVRDSRRVIAGILAGLAAMFYSLTLIPMAWFAAPAAVLTVYLVLLDREHLFAKPKAGT
jgi:hypothetical protein